jgi:hypothetical protein
LDKGASICLPGDGKVFCRPNFSDSTGGTFEGKCQSKSLIKLVNQRHRLQNQLDVLIIELIHQHYEKSGFIIIDAAETGTAEIKTTRCWLANSM